MKTTFKYGIIAVSFIIGSVAFLPDNASRWQAGAQETVVTPTPTPNVKKVEALKENSLKIQAAIKARKAELEAKIKQQKEIKKQKLEAAKKALVQKKLKAIFDRLNAEATKLTAIDATTTVKINEAGAAGKDITAVSQLLVDAQSALSLAKTDIAAAKAAAMDQTNTSTSAETIKNLVATADNSLKKAVEAYKKVRESLRAVGSTKPTDPTSPETPAITNI